MFAGVDVILMFVCLKLLTIDTKLIFVCCLCFKVNSDSFSNAVEIGNDLNLFNFI